MKRIILFFTIIMAVVAFSAIAYGEPMSISANVLASCEDISVLEDVVFGDYNTGTDSTDAGQISVTCTNGTQFKIAIDYGLYPDGTQRYLRNSAAPNPPTHDLEYGLYLDDGYSDPWGLNADTYPAGGIFLISDGTAEQPFVYGELPGGQMQAFVGGYNDTVEISIDFAP